jgi:hypothetical protein
MLEGFMNGPKLTIALVIQLLGLLEYTIGEGWGEANNFAAADASSGMFLPTCLASRSAF